MVEDSKGQRKLQVSGRGYTTWDENGSGCSGGGGGGGDGGGGDGGSPSGVMTTGKCSNSIHL